MPAAVPVWFPGLVALLLGAIIGSFLNAVIYRLPRGIALNNPRRSFCPACGHSIPWFCNIPVLSWITLRGRCKFCAAPISVRYPIVELLTALLFWAMWELHGWPHAPVYSLFVAFLIAATFIDIDFLIIPDEITVGGTVLGLLFCTAIPSLMHEEIWWRGMLLSLAGAASGFGLLWFVVELGKLAFGKKRHSFEKARGFVWRRIGDSAELEFEDGEKLPWEEIFSRESDELILECVRLDAPVWTSGREPKGAWEATESPSRLVFRYDRVRFDTGELLLDDLESFAGVASSLVIPREAMGFGDVKFLAAIGAFLGWKAVLFTIFVSSIVGCIAGIASLALRKQNKQAGLLPFGPFLALGAFVWLLGGDVLWQWYFQNF